jgi:hypothetical protein
MSSFKLIVAAGICAALLLPWAYFSSQAENKDVQPDNPPSPSQVTSPGPRPPIALAQPQFEPKNPVRARALQVFGPRPIPGAIVCADHETVELMVDLFKTHFKEQIEDQVVGSQMKLVRGDSMNAPDLAGHGCTLFAAGTLLDEIQSFGPAVQVEGVDRSGSKVKGVTDFLMVEKETSQ